MRYKLIDIPALLRTPVGRYQILNGVYLHAWPTLSRSAGLYRKTGIAVLNGDDRNVQWMRGETKARIITFGVNEANDVRASDIAIDWPFGTNFKLHADDKTYNVHIKLISKYMVFTILAAIAVAIAEGYARAAQQSKFILSGNRREVGEISITCNLYK